MFHLIQIRRFNFNNNYRIFVYVFLTATRIDRRLPANPVTRAVTSSLQMNRLVLLFTFLALCLHANASLGDYFSPIVSNLSVVDARLNLLATELDDFNDYLTAQEAKIEMVSDTNTFQETASIYAFKSYVIWYIYIADFATRNLKGVTLTQTKHKAVLQAIERIRRFLLSSLSPSI